MSTIVGQTLQCWSNIFQGLSDLLLTIDAIVYIERIV